MPGYDDADQWLTIGEFAEVALLSPKALRLYDDRQLLRPAWTDPVSGYRYYSPDQAGTGRLISLLRGAGVSLPEAETVIAAESQQEALKAIEGVRASLQQQSVAAEALLNRAAMHFTNTSPKGPTPADDRHVVDELFEDTVVLTALSPVVSDRLDEHMATEIRRLREVAKSLGVPVTGHPFGVFHGPVGDDSDGPLEVALPIAWMSTSPDDVRCYRVSGGHMATVHATGADTDYPEVLTAYDLACSWIETHGFKTIGPPREIWERLPWEGKASMTIAWPFAGPISRVGKS